MKRLIFTACLIMALTFSVCADPLRQVTFNEVLELPSDPPTQTYPYGSQPSQFYQYWPAKNNAMKASNVIFIHGGCWLKDYGIRHSYPLSTALTKEGFNLWSVEYRRLGEKNAEWPASLNDVLNAIENILRQTNGKPTAVIGHSAGGHLALLATSNDRQYAEQVDAVLGLAAITDMQAYIAEDGSCNQAAKALLETAKSDFNLAQADPKQQTLHHNTWLLQGSADNIVPMGQAGVFSVDNVNTMIVDDAGHFDMIHPQTNAWEAIVQRLKEELKQ
ncbi:esterase [Idiomarina piscisalsi]|uniref:Esterase n=1 Tax=Idiomarina piscisalsi TaxID=1096243 RepID=A0ABM6LR98_9GAMM|nr:alpha/beta hydrolase [Idiomarina piscisalsi]ASG65047.1 esterase [Idiomarina piscisalsi]